MQEDQPKVNVYSGRLTWGLTLMAIWLLITILVQANTFLNLGTQPVDLQNAGASTNPGQLILGCLGLIAFIVELVGVILIFADSRRVQGLPRRLAVFGLAFFILYLLTTGAGIGMSITMVFNGTLGSFVIATWITAIASPLGFLAALLLVFGIAPGGIKGALTFALVLSLVSTIGMTLLTSSHLALQTYQTANRTVYLPQINFDRSTGVYPILSGLGILATVLYLGAYITLVLDARSASKSGVSDAVK